MKKEAFKKVYRANPDEVSHTILQSLIMCGTQNWDFYFEKKPRNCDSETVENITLIEFDSFDEFETYKQNNSFLDFSLEHEKPMVLVHG